MKYLRQTFALGFSVSALHHIYAYKPSAACSLPFPFYLPYIKAQSVKLTLTGDTYT